MRLQIPRREKRLPPQKKPKPEWCVNSGGRTQRAELVQLETAANRGSTRSIYAGRTSIEAQAAIRLVQKTKHVRCRNCGRRLRPRAEYCVSGEFIYFALPKHKVKG